jgi:hypothetical protein
MNRWRSWRCKAALAFPWIRISWRLADVHLLPFTSAGGLLECTQTQAGPVYAHRPGLPGPRQAVEGRVSSTPCSRRSARTSTNLRVPRDVEDQKDQVCTDGRSDRGSDESKKPFSCVEP